MLYVIRCGKIRSRLGASPLSLNLCLWLSPKI
nr:MAG TPA_asm: hypothetical protein [Caudoviricetes sp.]